MQRGKSVRVPYLDTYIHATIPKAIDLHYVEFGVPVTHLIRTLGFGWLVMATVTATIKLKFKRNWTMGFKYDNLYRLIS